MIRKAQYDQINRSVRMKLINKEQFTNWKAQQKDGYGQVSK